MSALVTDQFRILNANNFIESVENDDNSYYIFLGLPNPTQVGFGRSTSWNINTPNPIDNFSYLSHNYDTMLFGKKLTVENVRRVIRRIDWIKGKKYEMYRHDYSIINSSPLTQSSRLYDAEYYVINSDYKVYICIDNGSSGLSPSINGSQDEPTFTDLEPSKAGESGDGYIWKYLFTVSPSDIIKFDSTEYITVPNNWSTTTNAQVQAIRENGDSDVNLNQIKKVYIEQPGQFYAPATSKEVDILGDGENGRVLIDTINGSITEVSVSSGGRGYSYGVIDLTEVGNASVPADSKAKLVLIIPPSKGHGYDIYKELGTDRILIYARFDDASKDFPIDTRFSQVGILKNPTEYGTSDIFKEPQFSSLYGIKFLSISGGTPIIGEKIVQNVIEGSKNFRAIGYVASYDTDTKVLKYFRDRSLYYNQTTLDETDYVGISSNSKVVEFQSSATANSITGTTSGFSGNIDYNFTGISTVSGTKIINLNVNFTNGLSNPEINKGSGEIIYLDNRPSISRNSRQKEDVKIILEF
jgi:hypothetical protein